MAVTVLSPWPTTPAALASATAYIREVTRVDTDTLAQRLGSTAAAMVEAFAAGAPQPVKNEATIRVAGYLAEAPVSGLRMLDVGSLRLVYDRRSRSPLRLSGAMDLLAPWRTPGAAKVESL